MHVFFFFFFVVVIGKSEFGEYKKRLYSKLFSWLSANIFEKFTANQPRLFNSVYPGFNLRFFQTQANTLVKTCSGKRVVGVLLLQFF